MNKKIEEDLFEEEILKSGIKKIGELFQGEIKLIRTILISSLTVIIICILLYFNYILIGQFFTTIFLSFIVSLALKPTKEKIMLMIEKYFRKNKYFTAKSTFFIIARFIFYFIKKIVSTLVNFIRKRREGLKKVESLKEIKMTNSSKSNRSSNVSSSNSENKFSDCSSSESYLTIFNNRNYLLAFLIFYVVVFKLETYLSLTLIVLYLLIDLLLRVLIDLTFSFVRFANRNSYFKTIFFEDFSEELNENVHSLISLVIITFFALIILVTLALFLWLFFIDLKSMVVYVQQNNEYRNYIHNILPENLKEYTGQDFDTFYNNNVFIHLKSFEAYINTTLEEQFGDELLRGNHTLYDLSNNIVNFLKDPSLIIDNSGKNYPLINLLDEKCANYRNEIISRIISFFNVEYARRFYCGLRILLDRFNLDMSISIVSKYLKQGYKFFSKTFKLIAGSIFLNILSLSLELINSLMLFILFGTCLFNFLKKKGDFIKDLLKFLPYSEKQISEIHKSFHSSIQGVFISTLDIFLYHTLLTWIIFDFCEIKFTFLFSTLSGIITLFPIVTPWIVLVPANLISFLNADFSIFKFSIFNLSYYLLINFADNDIYKKNLEKSDPYYTGLSFVMGMYTFGLKGFIYGPVLLCVSLTVIDIIKILIKFK